jgi:hypothetical protein
VARYVKQGRVLQGFVELASGGGPGGVVIHTGERIPGTKSIVTGFGLIERRGRHYIVQVYGRNGKDLASQGYTSEPAGYLVGKTGRGSSGARLVAASEHLGAPRSAVRGETHVGPRIHRDGTASTVVHATPDRLQLHRHGKRGGRERIARTGGRMGRGRIATISSPNFGPHGLLYYKSFGKRGMELNVVDGNRRHRIFESGDRVGGKKVRDFHFGWHTDQVDKKGRLVFQAQLADGRTAIVIGTPV